MNRPLSERTACWDFILEELENYAAQLPESRNENELGRATSGTAYAYIGFAYLTRAYEEPEKKSTYLDKALTALNNVKGYSLVSGENLIGMFNGTNKKLF